MPKTTFYNLDTAKRDKILKAAKEEFTLHELHKARVSNIIKKAHIPRGSFYQYFEDLDDLFFYVIDESFEAIYEYGYETSKKTNDIFEFAEITFTFDYNQFQNDKRHNFMMNVMKSIGENNDYIEKINENRENYVKTILQNMDLTKIKLRKIDDQLRMYYMIQSLKRQAISKSMFEKKTFEEAKQDFIWHLDLLKYGLLENKE